jgi:hypothetical protein
MWDYLEFEVEKEDWNILDLEDGPIIKTKFLMISLKKSEDEKGRGFETNALNIVGVMTPPERRGPHSDRDYTPEEIERSIINRDVPFKTREEGWSVYKLQDGSKLSVKLVTSQISKTDKFDRRGQSIYIVLNTAVPKFIPAKTE